MSELDTDNYGQLLGEIKQHIRSAQYEALKVEYGGLSSGLFVIKILVRRKPY